MVKKLGISPLRLSVLGLYLCFATICYVRTDATHAFRQYRARKNFRLRPRKHYFHALKRLDINMALDASNTDPYVSSPLSLPPFDALSPFNSPENPPYCIYPPSTIPSPVGGGYTPLPPPGPSPNSPSNPESPIPIPPESTPIPNPPINVPSPPSIIPNPPTTTVPAPTEPILSPPYYEPSPTEPILSPPYYEPSPPYNEPTPTEPILSPPYYEPSPPYYEPTPTEPILSPPYYEPSPPYGVPSPTGLVPRSPKFLPPIVFPPPAVPPPPSRVPDTAMWCVAKAAVPDPIILEAMNYACGSGADCNEIQPSGSCFQPNTLFAHASYAFNSYWQRTKVTGGRCDFGGTAILVTVDPSYDGCHFLYF